MRKVLVIGGTGMLGKPVVRKLAVSGFDVTLLARNPEKCQALFPDLKTVKGDVFDRQSLLHAMKGQEILYLNLSVSQSSGKKDPQPEREGVDEILAAAHESGVKRIAYLSSLIKNYQGMNNFHWWAFDIKQSAVDRVKKSGIPSTIFYPSTFMETFPYQMIHGHSIMLVGNSRAPMWFIAADDYARQVTEALRQDNGSQEYVIQGPEPFTFEEASEVVVKNHPRKGLRIRKAPLGLVKIFASFIPRLSYGFNICEALNKYPEKFESDKTWNELGKPEITLAEFSRNLS